jgi:type VI secretion system protein ImpJ
MSQMQNVLWMKGVLLNPQHLQTQDRYLEDKLAFHVSSLSFWPWGFTDYEVDAKALLSGEVRLVRASGILPDGLVFDIPHADVAPAPRSVEGHLRPDQSELTVYLAIPEFRRGGRNVSSALDDSSARFSPTVLAVRDENTGLAEKEILVAQKNFRLLFENESIDGSTVLPVAKLLRSASGEIRLDGSFVPELLDIAASSSIVAILRRIVEILSAKSTELSEGRRQKSRLRAEFSRGDVANFWFLYTINTHLPLFRHLYAEQSAENGRGVRSASTRVHPAELYRAMTELAASLMTFSPSWHPRDLPSYDHGRLSDCFRELDDQLRELLDTAIPGNCITLRLERTDSSIYVTSLDDDRQLSAVQAYLAVTAEMDQARLIQKAPDWIKVGSRDQIRDLMSHAVSGVALRHQPSPPGEVPVKVGCQYFHLEMSGPRWNAVKQSRSLAAWVADDIPKPELELVLIVPTSKD